jgi:hypothetical protein
VKVLGRVFRGKFVVGLKSAIHNGRLESYGTFASLVEPPIFAAWLRASFRQACVAYAKQPFGCPEYAARNLSVYTRRVAISNPTLFACTASKSPLDGETSLTIMGAIMTPPVDEFTLKALTCGDRACSRAPATELCRKILNEEKLPLPLRWFFRLSWPAHQRTSVSASGGQNQRNR